MEIPRRYLLLAQGLVWLAVGLYLLPLGVFFLLKPLEMGTATSLPLFTALSSLSLNAPEAACVLLTIGLIIGHFKSRKVFSKAVKRSEAYVGSLPEKTTLSKIYPPIYLLLILFMAGLGMAMKYFEVPLDIRGFIDVAVGSALIKGALLYFKAFRKLVLCA